MYATYQNTRKTIELTIANQGMAKAQNIVGSMNIEILEKFLQNQQSSEIRRQLSEEMKKSKRYTGVRDIYFIHTDEANQPRLIDENLAEDSVKSFGVCCKQLKELKRFDREAKPFTKRMEDPSGQTYVIAGVPIVSKKAETIGMLIIEEGIETVKKITKDVTLNSIPYFLFSGLFVLFSFSTFLIYQFWVQRKVTIQVGETEETYQGEFQSMLQTMRSIRHDFINHIQVIQGLLQLKKEERALEYVNSLTSEVISMELPFKVKNPALFILLQSKWARAQNDKVDMHIFVNDDEQFTKLKSIDLIRILSNLIDNAFDATLVLPESERFISIEAKATQAKYIFKVENIGPTIPEENVHKIFKAGFSTKQERHGVPRGDGLSIVKQVVDMYGGTINVTSVKNSTIFEIEIPV